MQLSSYLTKNDSLRKVEIEGESPSTPIDSAVTGERPHMDRDVTGSYHRVPVLFILDHVITVVVASTSSSVRLDIFMTDEKTDKDE